MRDWQIKGLNVKVIWMVHQGIRTCQSDNKWSYTEWFIYISKVWYMFTLIKQWLSMVASSHFDGTNRRNGWLEFDETQEGCQGRKILPSRHKAVREWREAMPSDAAASITLQGYDHDYTWNTLLCVIYTDCTFHIHT